MKYKKSPHKVCGHFCQDSLCKILVLYVYHSSQNVEVGKNLFEKKHDFFVRGFPYISNTVPSLTYYNFVTVIDIYIL